MPLNIVRDNIVHMKTDAIVNAANSDLSPGGGVCGSVFDAAGYEQMQQACRKLGGCPTGSAVITPGFNLPAKYVIHAVGPVWHGGHNGEEAQLRASYRSALALAKKHGLESMAFPLISSGIYGYPKDKALHVAVCEISHFLMENDMDIFIVVYDMHAYQLSENLFAGVRSYIDDVYVQQRRAYPHLAPGVLTGQCARRMQQTDNSIDSECELSYAASSKSVQRMLQDVVKQTEETFSESLLRLIGEKGKTDVEVYKKANIDRKLFSKIRSNRDYKPSKLTVLAFAVALELSLDETQDLLGRAGYVLSHSQKADVIVEYFIAHKNFDIFEINEALFAFEQPLLGI